MKILRNKNRRMPDIRFSEFSEIFKPLDEIDYLEDEPNENDEVWINVDEVRKRVSSKTSIEKLLKVYPKGSGEVKGIVRYVYTYTCELEVPINETEVVIVEIKHNDIRFR